MSWKEIKYALNSSVGTEGFKPLNEIVADAFGEIVAEQNLIRQKLYSGENDFYVSRAKNVDLDGFLDVLEQYKTARIVSGSYVGTGSSQTLSLEFVPKIVFIQGRHDHYDGDEYQRTSNEIAFYVNTAGNDYMIDVVDTGSFGISANMNSRLVVKSDDGKSVTFYDMSTAGHSYYYIAIG